MGFFVSGVISRVFQRVLLATATCPETCIRNTGLFGATSSSCSLVGKFLVSPDAFGPSRSR